MELSDDQITRLRRCPWLPGVHSDSKMGFLMKFYADPHKEECYFMVTDTVKVWAEGRYPSLFVGYLYMLTLSIRTLPTCRSQPSKVATSPTEPLLRHIPARINKSAGDMQIVAEEGGKCADLSLTISTPTLDWEWRTFALHPSHASRVLSQHLILPMLSHMSVFTTFGGGFDLEALTKQLDKTSKTARITMHTHIRAVFSKPVVACGLVRISQAWEHVGDQFLHPMVEDLEELEPVTAPLYFPEPISDDELEPWVGPEPDQPYYSSGSLRSSPVPLPDTNPDGSATEDEDEGDEGAGETQLESAVGIGSMARVESRASKYSQSQVPQSQFQSQSQSQFRPPIYPVRSQPYPSRSSAQLSMMSVPGGRSISQPQVAGQKRSAGSDSESADEYERAEELLRRMNGATSSGAIGMKKKAGRRKF